MSNRQTEKKKTLNIISVIGDSVVRNKLFEMFWEIFEEDSAINQEILFYNDVFRNCFSIQYIGGDTVYIKQHFASRNTGN